MCGIDDMMMAAVYWLEQLRFGFEHLLPFQTLSQLHSDPVHPGI